MAAPRVYLLLLVLLAFAASTSAETNDTFTKFLNGYGFPRSVFPIQVKSYSSYTQDFYTYFTVFLDRRQTCLAHYSSNYTIAFYFGRQSGEIYGRIAIGRITDILGVELNLGKGILDDLINLEKADYFVREITPSDKFITYKKDENDRDGFNFDRKNYKENPYCLWWWD